MKTRDGFVSNSSSSSFLCVIARVADKKLALKWMRTDNQDCTKTIFVFGTKDNHTTLTGSVRLAECDCCGTVTITSFNFEKVQLKGLKPGDQYVVLDGWSDTTETGPHSEATLEKNFKTFEGKYKEVMSGCSGAFTDAAGMFGEAYDWS
jgi:hypothetical protein